MKALAIQNSLTTTNRHVELVAHGAARAVVDVAELLAQRVARQHGERRVAHVPASCDQYTGVLPC